MAALKARKPAAESAHWLPEVVRLGGRNSLEAKLPLPKFQGFSPSHTAPEGEGKRQ